MVQSEALRLVGLLGDAGVQSWVDGGWGVDALLGEQTRDHSDLDLVVNREHLDLVNAILGSQGFAVIRDWLPNAIAFRDPAGAEVDLHPVDITGEGGGDQILLDGRTTWHYSPPVQGTIGGFPVLCCPVRDQLLCHLGYEPREHDRVDVGLLAERFGVPLPDPYSRA
jgi:lincosamide nucleotidyltransferase A/C/D/E